MPFCEPLVLLCRLQVAEFIDERPDEVKLMEEFRTNSKWKLLGGESSPFHPLSLMFGFSKQ